MLPPQPMPSAHFDIVLPSDVQEALNAWIKAQPNRLTLEEACTYALRDWLTGLGLLPFHDAPEDAH